MSTKKVLVAALNWGLGHASRCIPVVKAFERLGVQVVIASDGASLVVLKKEFPHLRAIELPSYDMRYSAKLPLALSICLQMPKILRNIKKENRLLKSLQVAENFDIVVSDCRFGCFLPGCFNVYITHQVRIRFPGFLSMLEGLGAELHKMVWKKFDYLWVIDRAGDRALSGDMGQSVRRHNLRYIGILSRFSDSAAAVVEKNIDVCFLLSGPEPHRTMLEKIIIHRYWPADKKYQLVRGLPHAAAAAVEMPGNWTVSNHLSSDELQTLLLSSKMIVCRSGYSTVMDLARLGLCAVLIPTPGQPEQEYLADYLSKKMHFSTLRQRALKKDGLTIQELPHAEPYRQADDGEQLSAAIREVLAR